ncbi:hypothetical protein ACHAQH_003878 [Verticillium albo-atrum]
MTSVHIPSPLSLPLSPTKASMAQSSLDMPLSPRKLAKQEESLCLSGASSLYIPQRDQAFWRQRTSETLAGLMRHAGSYTDAQTRAHLALLAELVVPSLGPRPGPEAQTLPLLTATNSPFEPSWNVTDAGTSAIRFSFEPLGRRGGDASDPFAQRIVSALLPPIAARAHGVDLQWFTSLQGSLFLTDDEAVVARSRLPKGVRAPTSFLAFDLDGDRAVFKAYFFPILKHIATGRPAEDVAFSAVRALPCAAGLAPAAERLERWLAAAPFPVPLEMLAIDCVAPSAGARVKVYGRTESNAFSVVRTVATLGGQVDDAATAAGLDALEAMWPLLHNETAEGGGCMAAGSEEGKAPRVRDTRHKGVCYGFELRPGCTWPETKVYVPVWQYAESDAVVARNLAEIFRRRGWTVGERYEDAIPACFPRTNTENLTGTHSYVSFAFSEKKGVYMTMYYSIKPQEALVAL